MGPYFTKKWVLIGSLSQSLGVLISFRDSAVDIDDGFNTKVCSVDNIIIVVYINGVGYMGSSEMSQIWVLW